MCLVERGRPRAKGRRERIVNRYYVTAECRGLVTADTELEAFVRFMVALSVSSDEAPGDIDFKGCDQIAVTKAPGGKERMMSDEQIKILKDRLEDGHRMFWVAGACAMEIIRVDHKGDEPSEVGRFGDGTYIALYGVDPAEIFECRRLFT